MWTSNTAIAIYILLGFIAIGVVVWLFFKKTLRSRLKMGRMLKEDPDINDWLIIFDWTPKILYMPTIVASFIAAIVMLIAREDSFIEPKTVGGIWFVIFFINFLIEEYSISIKILLIFFVGIGFLFLWLHLLGWVNGFLGLFKNLALAMSGIGYLLVTLIGLLTIGISWLKGLFYYVTITPNYMNLQMGPTESGEQIGREDYNTKIDTSDFLERLMGFGRIIVTFKDNKKQPLSLLVWRINKKAELLEKVRAKFAIDYPQLNNKPHKPEQ
jgi:hypothetical protein